jgi:hypothetical protein
MKLNVADMDANGKNDVVISGKAGLYIFYNHGEPDRGRPQHRMTPEAEYPTWIPWHQR